MPTLIGATIQPGASGIAAQAPSARVTLISGASRNTNLSAPAGTIISFSRNFPKSANDCSSPNGPTTFGPLRICTPANSLRSPQIRKAQASSSTTVTSRIWPKVSSVQSPGVDAEIIFGDYSAASLEAPAASAAHSAIVTLARAIGLVRWKAVIGERSGASVSSPAAPRPPRSNVVGDDPGA